MKKQSWKLRRNSKTGEIITGYYSGYTKSDPHLFVIDNFIFEDTIIYSGCQNSASSVEISFTSIAYPTSVFVTSIKLLDRIFDKNLKSNIEIICAKPLTLKGRFTFVKKGSVVHLEEVL